MEIGTLGGGRWSYFKAVTNVAEFELEKEWGNMIASKNIGVKR